LIEVELEVELEMVTNVGAPGLFVNVAMSSGTVLGVGVEFQLLPWVHSLETGAPPPIQVPSVACAAFGANAASAPSQTLPSSAARGAAGAAAPADATDMNAYPNPCGRLPPRPKIAPRPTLRVEPVTINSRSSLSARIAAACGLSATLAPPGHRLGLRPGTRHK
jgi:hypothetical protein